ncbi:MAG: GNAT family N-acetyltransferase [Acidimicrobiales bacterium]
MQARVVAPTELTSADVARWSECAASSLEPNPFFEPGWLLPALAHLDESPTTVLVFAEHDGAVHAFVPVEEIGSDDDLAGARRTHATLVTRVVPTAVALTTPLVVAERAVEALMCLMSELLRMAEERGADLVVMEWVARDGRTARLLRDAADRGDHHLIEFDSWERGFLRRRSDLEDSYWLRAIGKNRRRTIRQHRQRLDAVLGSTSRLRTRTDPDAIDAFLRLEASGWKGRDPGGLALRRQSGSAAFFDAVCRCHLDGGRMWFVSLEGDSGPIAMVCCLRGGDGVFAIRTAYDEDLARFGPGVEVFLAAMERFDRDTDARWFDSCSGPDNRHLLGLFPDRRALATMMFRVHDHHGPRQASTDPVVAR